MSGDDLLGGYHAGAYRGNDLHRALHDRCSLSGSVSEGSIKKMVLQVLLLALCVVVHLQKTRQVLIAKLASRMQIKCSL